MSIDLLKHCEMKMSAGMQHSHQESNLSTSLFLTDLLVTSGALAVALVITNIFVPIKFTFGG